MFDRDIERVCALSLRLFFGARLERVYDADACFYLQFRGEAGKTFIVLDTEMRSLYVSERRDRKDSPSMFTMKLRKEIENLRLRDAEKVKGQKVVKWHFGVKDLTLYILVFEIFARDILLVDVAENTVIASLSGKRSGEYCPDTAFYSEDDRERFAEIADKDLLAVSSKSLTEDRLRKRCGETEREYLKILKPNLKKSLKTEQAVISDIANAGRAESLRKEGDLLQSYFSSFKKGDASVTLIDYETECPIVIALDPSLEPRHNIEKKYKSARSLSKGKIFAEKRLEEIRSKIAAYRDFESKLEYALRLPLEDRLDALVALKEPFERLFAAVLARRELQNAKTSSSKKDARVCYRRFVSEKGIEIRVGKSAQDNDELTFRHSSGNDIWMHCASGPGSHVVVKASDPDDETILDAATLALHYAKIDCGKSGEVLMCHTKFVKRIKGAPPGKVATTNPKKKMIRMDEKRLKRLLEN